MKLFVIFVILFLSAFPFQALADTGCLNEGCHKKLLDSKFVHGPVAVEECSHCHAQTAKHNFKPALGDDKICAECHDDVKTKGVKCVKCHDPHGSAREFQLKANISGKCAK